MRKAAVQNFSLAKVEVPGADDGAQEEKKETSEEEVKKTNDAAAEELRIEQFPMVRREDQQALKECKKKSAVGPCLAWESIRQLA